MRTGLLALAGVLSVIYCTAPAQAWEVANETHGPGYGSLGSLANETMASSPPLNNATGPPHHHHRRRVRLIERAMALLEKAAEL